MTNLLGTTVFVLYIWSMSDADRYKGEYEQPLGSNHFLNRKMIQFSFPQWWAVSASKAFSAGFNII